MIIASDRWVGCLGGWAGLGPPGLAWAGWLAWAGAAGPGWAGPGQPTHERHKRRSGKAFGCKRNNVRNSCTPFQYPRNSHLPKLAFPSNTHKLHTMITPMINVIKSGRTFPRPRSLQSKNSMHWRCQGKCEWYHSVAMRRVHPIATRSH